MRDAVERGALEVAWERVVSELVADREHDELLRLAGRVLRHQGEPRLAVLFERAGDAPHDPQRLLELGSSLLGREEPELAAALLERALAFVPFDAVIRSELALALARAGRPHEVLEVLALHPCLADDAGALFEFAWAALLMGDRDSARDALRSLRGAPALRRKLELAVNRAERAASEKRDARHFYFLEHGGLLLDSRGPLAGRYEEIATTEAWTSEVTEALAVHVLTQLGERIHVLPVQEGDLALAERVASKCGGTVQRLRPGRLPAGIAVTRDGAALQAIDVESWRARETLFFALTMDWARSASRAPDIVGGFGRRVTAEGPERDELDPGLAPFVGRHRPWLPPHGPRTRAAYVPDAPLAR